MLAFSWVDYTLFCGMLSISTIIGIYYGCCGNKQSTTRDYLYGGGNMKYIPVGISMIASTLSGISLLGIPADVYMYGTQFWITIVGAILMAIITNFVYLPVFYNLQLSSTYEYLNIRFDTNVSKLASFLFAISNFLTLPIIIFAPTLALSQVTGLNSNFVAPVMTIFCIFYTTIGGLKTVVWTDALQFIVTLITLMFVLVMGTISVGGIASVWETAGKGDRIEFFNMDPDPTLRATFWSVAIGQTFLWISFIGIHPAGIQRFLATPTLSDAKRTLLLFVIGTIITKSISCFSGLIMFAKYSTCDPLYEGKIKKADQILPFYVMDVAGQIPGLSGLFIAGIFSTSLSTLSTYLNSLAGIVYTDFIVIFMHTTTSEKTASNIIKLTTVVIGLASLGLSFVMQQLGSIIEIWMSLNGIASGPLIGLFTLGMLCPFSNSKGALYGGIGSLLFMSWMIIKTTLHIKAGNIKYIPKPFNNTCNFNHTLITTLLPANSTYATESPFWLFKVTFHYYPLIGALITILIGAGISWTMGRSQRDVKIDLLSPCVHRFLSVSNQSTQYRSVEKELNIVKHKKENESI